MSEVQRWEPENTALGYNMKPCADGSFVLFDVSSKAEAALRQQLADVSNERDLLKADLERFRMQLAEKLAGINRQLLADQIERDALQLRLNASEHAKAEMESTLQYISTSASSRSPSSLRALAKGALDKVRGISAQSAPATDEQGAGS